MAKIASSVDSRHHSDTAATIAHREGASQGWDGVDEDGTTSTSGSEILDLMDVMDPMPYEPFAGIAPLTEAEMENLKSQLMSFSKS